MTGSTVFPQVVLSKQDGTPYDADLPVPVTIAGGASISSGATATASAPTYTEGSTDPLSVNLTGDLRVIAKQSGTWSVTGTFWQTTQPVSGTFWQTTQPVSIASMPTTAVTGTFWQATQPVSGTFWQATQPVSNAGTFAVQATQAGTWTVGLSAAQTLATVTTVGAVTAITNALPAGTNLLGKVGIDQTTPGTTNAVTVSSAAGTLVATTVATGGTAANAFGATPANGYEVINPHATETLYIRENGTATVADNSTSIPIGPKGSYTTPAGYKPTGDVSYNAATTGHAIIARRW